MLSLLRLQFVGRWYVNIHVYVLESDTVQNEIAIKLKNEISEFTLMLNEG